MATLSHEILTSVSNEVQELPREEVDPNFLLFSAEEAQNLQSSEVISVADTRTAPSAAENTTNTDTCLTESGVKIVRTGKAQDCFYEGRRIPLQGSTLRILEIVSLYPEGIAVHELHGLVGRLTASQVTESSLDNHLSAIRGTFALHKVPGWVEVMKQQYGGKTAEPVVRLEGATPRSPEDWPDYMNLPPRKPHNEAVLLPLHLANFLLSDVTEETWQERALCAETDPEAFFPEKGGSYREAKKICTGCEVRAECLEYALENDEPFGIWGGLSERERRRPRRRRS